MGRACGVTYADAVRDAELFEIRGQIIPGEPGDPDSNEANPSTQ